MWLYYTLNRHLCQSLFIQYISLFVLMCHIFVLQHTIVEILLYYLTYAGNSVTVPIYNSRNSFILLNLLRLLMMILIYNSRNSFILLNLAGRKYREIIYNSRNSFILLNSYTVNIHNWGSCFSYLNLFFLSHLHTSG